MDDTDTQEIEITEEQKNYIYNAYLNNKDFSEISNDFNLDEETIISIIAEMEEKKDSEQNTDSSENVQEVENKTESEPKHKIKNSIIMPIISFAVGLFLCIWIIKLFPINFL